MIEKRLFIGSTADEITLVEEVVSLIGDHVKCVPWTRAFEINKSALESLLKQAKLSDFAILVATKDDLIIKRGETIMSPRDNVILEFGLFLGATSPGRCFLLAEEGAGLPSDLAGTNVCTFTRESGKYNSLPKIILDINKAIQKASKDGELGLLPSTALAIGYFNGFIKKICTEINKAKAISVAGEKVRVKNFKITVVIPRELHDDGVDGFTEEYNEHHKLTKASTFVEAEVGSKGRGYPFSFRIDTEDLEDGGAIDIHITDVPNTISTIGEALKLYMPSSSIGLDDEKEYLEKRELENFAKVLRYLIDKNSLAKKHVTIEVDVKI